MYEAHTGTVIGLFIVVLATIAFLIYMLFTYSKDDHTSSNYMRPSRNALEIEKVRFTSTTSDDTSPAGEVWIDVARIT